MVHLICCSNKSVVSVAWNLSNCSSQELRRFFGLSNLKNLLTLFRSMRWNHHSFTSFCVGYLAVQMSLLADHDMAEERFGRFGIYHLSLFQKWEVKKGPFQWYKIRKGNIKQVVLSTEFIFIPFHGGMIQKDMLKSRAKGWPGSIWPALVAMVHGSMISTCSIFEVGEVWYRLSLKLTANAPKKRWLEDDSFPFGAQPIFRGKLLVSERVILTYENTWNELTQWYDQEIVSWFLSQIWINRSDHPISPFVLPGAWPTV